MKFVNLKKEKKIILKVKNQININSEMKDLTLILTKYYKEINMEEEYDFFFSFCFKKHIIRRDQKGNNKCQNSQSLYVFKCQNAPCRGEESMLLPQFIFYIYIYNY